MGRRKKGEDDESIKARLTDKLGEHFLMKGFGAFTMDSVSQAFKVSKKTLYRFFPTKDEMILQVSSLLGGRIRSLAAKRLKAIEEGGPADFVPNILDFLEDMGSILLMLPTNLLLDLQTNAPIVAEKVDSMRRAIIMEYFTRILDAGKAKGSVRPDLDSELTSFIYSAMLQTLISRKGLSPAHSPYEVFSTAVSIMFEGILGPEAREAFRARTAKPRISENPWQYLKRKLDSE
jgi:AcrR family transcriptional regulator